MAYLSIISLLVALFNVSSACFSSWVAGQKGHSGTNWFFLGLIFGPLALLAIAGAPTKTH